MRPKKKEGYVGQAVLESLWAEANNYLRHQCETDYFPILLR